MEYDETKTIREQLSAYLDDELSEADSSRVEAAVAADAQLAEELRQLRATRALLGALPPRKPDAAFTTKVMQRIADGPAAAATAAPTGRGMRIFAAAAVVVALVGVGLVAVLRMYEKQPAAGDTPQIAAKTEPEKLGEIARGDLKKFSHAEDAADKSGAKTSNLGLETPGGKAPATIAAKSIRSPAKGVGAELGRRTKAIPKGATGISGKMPAKKDATFGISKSKLAAKPGAAAAPVARAKGRRSETIGQKGGAGVTTRARKGPADVDEYNFASNRDDATEEALVSLAKASRTGSNSIIWTDNITDGKKSVEKLLYSNGFAMAPKTQSGILPSQAMNLNVSMAYNKKLSRAIQAETVEVEYLVYGTEEQLARLQKQLQQDVQVTQVVSQLAQPHYNKALEEGQKPVAAKTVATPKPAEPAKAAEPSRTVPRPACPKPAPAKPAAPAKPDDTVCTTPTPVKAEPCPKIESAGKSTRAETPPGATTDDKRQTTDAPTPTQAAKEVLTDDVGGGHLEKNKGLRERICGESQQKQAKRGGAAEKSITVEQSRDRLKSQAKQSQLGQTQQASQPVLARRQRQQARRVQAMLITLRFRRRIQLNAVQVKAIEQAERKCNILHNAAPQAKDAAKDTSR